MFKLVQALEDVRERLVFVGLFEFGHVRKPSSVLDKIENRLVITVITVSKVNNKRSIVNDKRNLRFEQFDR